MEMKILTTKTKFIKKIASNYQCEEEGMAQGLKLWKESLISIKRCYWRKGKLTTSPARLISFLMQFIKKIS
jgi:hypothetical protein